MLERLTDCARHAVDLADELARSSNSSLTPEHLVLGIIQVRKDCDDDPQPGRDGFVEICGEENVLLLERELSEIPPLWKIKGGWVTWSTCAHRALEVANQTAIATEDREVRLGHLIVGILSQSCPAATMLKRLGITEQNVMSQIHKYLSVAE